MQEKLAVLARAGDRPISRANANALAAEGNAGKDYGAGRCDRDRGQSTPGPCAARAGGATSGRGR